MATLDIYEVDPCHRGHFDEAHARFVAAGDAVEAAYKVAGAHLHSEGEHGKLRLRVRRLGNGSPPAKLFYAVEAGGTTGVRSMPEKTKQKQEQISKERRHDREKSGWTKSSGHLPPIYDENFARRAGQIVASALAAPGARRK